jgi:hypothetical protein
MVSIDILTDASAASFLLQFLLGFMAFGQWIYFPESLYRHGNKPCAVSTGFVIDSWIYLIWSSV